MLSIVDADELMSIGVFARRCGLSISALRFYDECDVLKPAVVDAVTGYRSYAETQLGVATMVRALRQLEMPVAQIRTFLTSGPEDRHRAVKAHLAGLADQLAAAEEEAVALHRMIDSVEETMTTMSVTADDLGRAIDQVLPFVGHDDKRPQLHGVLVEGRAGSVRLVATDSYRLAVRDLVAGDGEEEFRAVVAAASLERLRADATGDTPARLRVDGGELVLEMGGATATAELVADAFPDYEKILVVHDDAHPLVVPRAALLEAVETEDGAVLWMTLQKDSLLTGKDGSYFVPASYDGPDLTVTLNRDFARDGILAAIGPDVVIEATSPRHPVVFRSATDGTYVHMVMPVLVRDS